MRRDPVLLYQKPVQDRQHQNQTGDDNHVCAVQPHQYWDTVGEVRREPQPNATEQITDLDVVTKGLKSLLVPLQHRSGE